MSLFLLFDLRLIVIESIMHTIGLWDTHYDIIRWGKFMKGVMIMDEISFWGWCDVWTYPYKNTDRERKNTNHTYRNCWYFSLIILPFIREEADDEVRRGSSTFKNMPFLGVEDALLEARKVSSLILYVTYWFLESYKLAFKKRYTPVLRLFNSLRCNDFSYSCWLPLRVDRLLRCFHRICW